MDVSLIVPAFIAGLLTFLAPCTLPLVPGYIGFISGVSIQELQSADQKRRRLLKRKVVLNSLFYIFGFSLIFILLGTIFSAGGALLVDAREWLARIGGLVVIFFGLHMMGVLNIPALRFLNQEHKMKPMKAFRPGNPISSFIFGSTFALGWTPCVGPVLGTILLLASTNTTVGQGAFLLLIFSIGLGLPFFLIALGIGHAGSTISFLAKYTKAISIVGGIFLVFLGIILVTDNMVIWLRWAYELFSFINYEALLEYL